MRVKTRQGLTGGELTFLCVCVVAGIATLQGVYDWIRALIALAVHIWRWIT